MGSNSDVAELVVKLKGREIQRVPITKLSLSIGRDQSCDVRIDNAGISRLHVAVRVTEGRVFAVDAGSRNGTQVNGKPIKIQALGNGDEITLGKYSVVFDEKSGPPVPSGTASMAIEQLEDVGDDDDRPHNVQSTVMMTPEQIARAQGKLGLPPQRAAAPQVASDPPPTRSNLPIILLVVAVLLGAAFVAGWALGH